MDLVFYEKPFYSKLPDAFENLSKSQERAIELIDDFFNSDDNCFILMGYAGTGKTFLLNGITKYLHSKEHPFFLMAPTGRAAQIISHKTKFKAFTIHKSIYMMNYIAEEYSEEAEAEHLRYFFNVKKIKEEGAVFIIDEASMISNNPADNEIIKFGSGSLLADLIKFTYGEKNKIIFVGDPAQLPPVNSNFSPALNKSFLEKSYGLKVQQFELTDVIRQSKNSDLLTFATNIRDLIRENQFEIPNLYENSEDIRIVETNQLHHRFIEVTNNQPTRNSVIIAKTNRLVNYYNRKIRKSYFPHQGLNIGDILLIVQNNYNYDFDLMNGDFAEVIALENETHSIICFSQSPPYKDEFEFIFRNITIKLITNDERELVLNVKIIENLLFNEMPDLSEVELLALYNDFKLRNPQLSSDTNKFKTLLKEDPYVNALRVKFGYAITCHKAQGGEWENVFVDFRSTQKKLNANFMKWIYTSLTRSRKNIFLQNMPFSTKRYYIDFEEEADSQLMIKENQILILEEEIIRILKNEYEDLIDSFEFVKKFPHVKLYAILENEQLELHFWFNSSKELMLVNSTHKKQKVFSLLFEEVMGKSFVI